MVEPLKGTEIPVGAGRLNTTVGIEELRSGHTDSIIEVSGVLQPLKPVLVAATSLLSTTMSSRMPATRMPRLTLAAKPRFSPTRLDVHTGQRPQPSLMLETARVVNNDDADAGRINGESKLPDRIDRRVRRSVGRDDDRDGTSVFLVPSQHLPKLGALQQTDLEPFVEPEWA